MTEEGLQILLSQRLEPRRARLAMRSIELMVARRWSTALITDDDLARAAERVDRALLRERRRA